MRSKDGLMTYRSMIGCAQRLQNVSYYLPIILFKFFPGLLVPSFIQSTMYIFEIKWCQSLDDMLNDFLHAT